MSTRKRTRTLGKPATLYDLTQVVHDIGHLWGLDVEIGLVLRNGLWYTTAKAIRRTRLEGGVVVVQALSKLPITAARGYEGTLLSLAWDLYQQLDNEDYKAVLKRGGFLQ
jgi:hypothetical protein